MYPGPANLEDSLCLTLTHTYTEFMNTWKQLVRLFYRERVQFIDLFNLVGRGLCMHEIVDHVYILLRNDFIFAY